MRWIHLLFLLTLAAAAETPANQLILAMSSGKADQVAQILQQNPGLVNQPLASGSTPLIASLGFANSGPLLDALLNAGANPNQTTANGTTPVLACIGLGKTDALQKLLNYKANPNGRSATGRRPLQAAVQTAFLKDVPTAVTMIQTLCKAGADPNKTDNGGMTPLFTAIGVGQAKGDEISVQIVQALLDGGANPNLKAQMSAGAPKVTVLQMMTQGKISLPRTLNLLQSRGAQ